ncbi:MAG: nucleoside phosphorylase [Candidatus Hodarchaeota archaeon]
MDFFYQDLRIYIDPFEEMKLYRAAYPLPSKLIYSPFNRPEIEKKRIKGKIMELPMLYRGTHLYCLNEDVLYFQGLMGAPVAAIFIERLIALGIQEIIFLGLAGGIQDVSVGDRVLVTEALRFEGTSYHYLPAKAQCLSSKELTNDLERFCIIKEFPYIKGKVCSTDARFRETFDLVEHLRQKNVLAIEMEISAVFAIAIFRQVQASAIVIISDELKDERWDISEPLIYSNPYFTSFEFLVEFLSQRD